MKYSNKNKINKTPSKSNTKQVEKKDFVLADFLAPYSNIIGYLLTALAFVMALFVFVPDVSVGGDDSTYLESAYKFANGTAFPTWQGPVYPMLLGYLSHLFGFHIILFKFLSVLFFAASVFLTHRLLSKFADAFTAVAVSAVSAVSYMLLLYASSTYTEPFFMMLQSGFLLYLLEIMEREPQWSALDSGAMWKKYCLNFGLLAVLAYVMFQTRSLAIVVIPSVIVYLLLAKKYKPAAVFAGVSVLCHIVNTVYRRLFWDVESVSFRNQLDSILLVNPYDQSAGYETLGGYLHRFWDNSVLYLSKHFMKLLGWYDYDDRFINTTSTVVILIILLSAGIYIWRQNRKLFLVYGYTAVMVGVTFVMLQKMWDQERLIMIYFPLMAGMLLHCIYKVSGRRWIIPLMLAGVVFAANLVRTIGRADGNLRDHFDGGSYKTYSDDWRNYMLASKWASDSLPEGSVVICRKSQMSWIAADGAQNVKFQGLYKLHTFDSDSMRAMLMDTLKGTHVILANLRLNPYELNGRTITTVRNSLKVLIENHAPELKFLKQFGTREPAYIFELQRGGEPDERAFQAAVVVDPESPAMWHNLIICYLKSNDLGKARRTVEEAVRLNSGNSEMAGHLEFMSAVVYFEAHEFEKAIEGFDKVLALMPDNFDAQYNKAVALYNLRRFAEALPEAHKALELGADPEAVRMLESAIRSFIR